MEISLPVSPSKLKKYFSEESVQDICYLPHSHCLIHRREPGLELDAFDYDTAFSQIKTGMLAKKTMNTNWQDRFFVLTPVRLLYYSSAEQKQLKGCFNLASLIQHKLEITAAFPEIILSVRTTIEQRLQDKKLLVLLLPNRSSHDEWFTALRYVLSTLSNNMVELKAFPKLNNLTLLDCSNKFSRTNGNFWNKLSISPTEMLNYASHLDILFLRNKSIFSTVHRFFMRSYYDHVGILLKDEAEKPYLLEVVNGKGVTISPLQNLLNSAHEEYEEIGYRKLLCQPSLLPLEQLQSYINSLIGKKYELSLSKLFLSNETEAGDEVNASHLSGEEEEKPEKTYFCSELIADIYLKFGVLKAGKSHQYWPKDFEEDTLPMSGGYSLSPIMRVELGQESSDVSALDQ